MAAKPVYNTSYRALLNRAAQVEREQQRMERIESSKHKDFQELVEDWEYSVMAESNPTEQLIIDRAFQRTERRMHQNKRR